jgi:putative transposase
VRYLSRRDHDADLRDAIKQVTRERLRFGYLCIHVMVAREGFQVNHQNLRRVYAEEMLEVRRRGGRKCALGTRKPMVLPPLMACKQTTAGQWTIQINAGA